MFIKPVIAFMMAVSCNPMAANEDRLVPQAPPNLRDIDVSHHVVPLEQVSSESLVSAEEEDMSASIRASTPLTAVQAPVKCPPPGLKTKEPFNLEEYISKEWYSVAQMPIQFQQKDRLFCTRAQYAIAEKQPWWLQCKKKTKVTVNNYANENEVNGQVVGGELAAVVKRGKESKLKVGPEFLLPVSSIAYGPYWVIEAGTYDSLLQNPDQNAFTDATYEWALISGGPPKQKGDDGFCKTGSGVNNAGLWIFVRDPTPPAGVTEAVKALAKRKGYDVNVLEDVVQEGCLYADA